MRFLTAYFAVERGEVILTGSQANARTSYQSIGRALEQLRLKHENRRFRCW
jgi:hypothetical protein